MSDDSDISRAAIFEILDNQLRLGSPPETRETLDRLLANGYAEQEARRLIACVLVCEIYAVMHDGREYDNAKYTHDLRALPKLPWD